MGRCYSLLLASLVASCATNSPRPQQLFETVHDCSEIETQGSLRFAADVDGVGWSDEMDGVKMSAQFRFLNEAEKLDFAQHGFRDQHYDHPILFFDYPRELEPAPSNGYTVLGESLENVFGGARGSGHSIQKTVSSNVFLTLNWKQVQTLTRDSDMFVFLYDRSGLTHKTLHFSQGYFESIEERLQDMHEMVVLKQTDRTQFCTSEVREVGEDIIVF